MPYNTDKVKLLRRITDTPIKKLCEISGAKSANNYHQKEKGELRFSIEEAHKLAQFYSKQTKEKITIEDLFYKG